MFSIISLLAGSAVGQSAFWSQTNGPSGGRSELLIDSRGDIFDAKRDFLRSTDGGISWKNLTPDFFEGYPDGWAASINNDLFLLVGYTLYRSQDYGESWIAVLQNIPPCSLYASNTGPLYLVDPREGGFMWRSTDRGVTWSDLTPKLPAPKPFTFFSITPIGKLISFSFEDSVIYLSADNGDSWQARPTLPFRISCFSMQSTFNGDLYCLRATASTATDDYNGVTIRSTDNGVTWDSINKGIDLIVTQNDVLIEAVSMDSFQLSTDYGSSWHAITIPDARQLINTYFVTDQKGNIYWSGYDRVCKYNTTTGMEEEISLPVGDINTLLVDRTGMLYAQGTTSFSTSSDHGNTWSTLIGNVDSMYAGNFQILTLDSSGGIIGTFNTSLSENSRVCRTTDKGKSWYTIHEGFPVGPFTSFYPRLLTTPNGNIFLLTSESPALLRSSDLGKSWVADTLGLPAAPLTEITSGPDGILYIASGQNIFRSTNNGDSWEFVINILDPFLFKNIVTNSSISSLAATSKGEVYAGTTHDGVIVSSDQGLNWHVANEGLDSALITALFAAPNGDIFGLSYGGSLQSGIIYRPFGGSRWYNANDGLRSFYDVTAIAFGPDGTAYLGTLGRGVWIGKGIVNAVPLGSFEQSRPTLNVSANPVITDASITYSLPSDSYARLELCDAIGRTLVTLASGWQDAGEHSLNTELNMLWNGMYFLRLSSASKTITQKLIINR
ncbi:MAG: T9SS type A sorting domain-containing protein [Bacteroidota bacterium]|nr:T9SS type A sorting domain-containing protein [Bacteroidota bacterium]MDP4236671.1 T9SS type A sorting domain-containing protein [Bacteroidota bacterium]